MILLAEVAFAALENVTRQQQEQTSSVIENCS